MKLKDRRGTEYDRLDNGQLKRLSPKPKRPYGPERRKLWKQKGEK